MIYLIVLKKQEVVTALVRLLVSCRAYCTPAVTFNYSIDQVDNEVAVNGGTSYNVVGTIKGTGNTGKQIILAGHYDKYWAGFNDDCAAIGAIAGIAKALIDSGYKPYYDIVIVDHAAEEWARAESKLTGLKDHGR